MYGIYANIWGILMINVTIYTIHGSYGYVKVMIEGVYIHSIFGSRDVSADKAV